MTNQPLEPLSQIVTTGIQDAVAKALDRHRRLGESVVIMRGDKIVTLAPEDIARLQLEQDCNADAEISHNDHNANHEF